MEYLIPVGTALWKNSGSEDSVVVCHTTAWAPLMSEQVNSRHLRGASKQVFQTVEAMERKRQSKAQALLSRVDAEKTQGTELGKGDPQHPSSSPLTMKEPVRARPDMENYCEGR